MKTKKIPYYILLSSLTIGASIILGFLSFGGMFALWPILSVAISAFALSVGYEGEVYLQNIKGALSKLFQRNYLQSHFANEHLKTHFPTAGERPKFFVDYENLLKLLHKFEHKRKRLSEDDEREKNLLDIELKRMEKIYADAIFSESGNENETEYDQALKKWLQNKDIDQLKEQLLKRKRLFRWIKGFSVVAGAFMALGTTYLLVEAFTVIPWFAAIPSAWPAMIIPMAIVAGTAYGLLTYNTITDMINNDTIRKWYHKIRDSFKNGITFRNVSMVVSAVLVAALAVVLTLCTAGTWWTIAKNAKPLFAWMKNIPVVVMGIFNPLITGASAFAFNLQNSSESLEIIDDLTQPSKKPGNVFSRSWNGFVTSLKEWSASENWVQMINPFRIITKLTMLPLRFLLFLGHLVSIGVTSDRVPGVPQAVSATIGTGCEALEDAHYFIGHSHSHEHGVKGLLEDRLGSGAGHSHGADLPTRILKILLSPVYFLAAVWDWASSKLNHSKEVLTFKRAWEKQNDIPPISKPIDIDKKPQLSPEGKKAMTLYRIRKKLKAASGDEADLLQDLATKISDKNTNTLDKIGDCVRKAIPSATGLFKCRTKTRQFLDRLSYELPRPG